MRINGPSNAILPAQTLFAISHWGGGVSMLGGSRSEASFRSPRIILQPFGENCKPGAMDFLKFRYPAPGASSVHLRKNSSRARLDPLQLGSAGGVHHRKAPFLQLVADAVGLGPVLLLAGLLAAAQQLGQLGGQGLALVLLPLLLGPQRIGLGEQVQGKHAVEVRQQAALGGAVELGLEDVVDLGQGQGGVQIVLQRLQEGLAQGLGRLRVHLALGVHAGHAGDELFKGVLGVLQVFKGNTRFLR